jgi:transcriptional regulator with XRE-family HTH domain
MSKTKRVFTDLEKEFLDDVAGRLKQYRLEQGLTLRGLSEMCDLSTETIRNIEGSCANPTISSLYRVAKALGGNLSVGVYFCD